MAVNVCVMFDPVLPLAPLTLVCVTVHVYVVPATLLDKATEVAPPEQKVCEFGEAVAVGIGLTVTVAVIAAPKQVPTLGVMV